MTDSNSNKNWYSLHLPIFLTGADLDVALVEARSNATDDATEAQVNAEALILYADALDGAAAICRRLAASAAEGIVENLYGEDDIIEFTAPIEYGTALESESIASYQSQFNENGDTDDLDYEDEDESEDNYPSVD